MKIDELIKRYPAMEAFKHHIMAIAENIVRVYKNSNSVLLCGNGGSAGDCEHVAGELIKEFKIKRPADKELSAKLEKAGYGILAARLQGGISAQSLVSQSAILTAISNDIGYDMAFAQQVASCGRRGDMLLAFSTSGNSLAVCNAAVVAKAKGLLVAGFTGESGGTLKPLCDICINVPESETYKVQELHLPAYHAVCAIAEDLIWGRES